jgi:HPt (histidine-containing phosphotransfer) domain-containing protein
MDDYLAKPVSAADLFAAIDRATAGGSDKVTHASVASPVTLSPCHLVTLSELDPATLLAACDGDAELLRKMCRHFQALVPARLAEVSEALRDRDAERLQAAAHKLGGMVSSFSAAAAESVTLLSRLGSEGQFEEATQTHARLNEMVGQLIAVLGTLSVEELRRRVEDSAGTPGRH